MPVFTKESLETLRSKVDLYEVVAPYVSCKKAGGTYKALCPFHKEKSPSFVIQKGDSHYHCFGCGAHGDAIAFLMNYLKLTFSEAVEVLAEKFGVLLEYQKGPKEKSLDLGPLRKVLNATTDFYHFHLMHTDEGHKALEYFYKRGIDLDFVKQFKIGFSPKNERFSMAFFQEEKFPIRDLITVGLVKEVRVKGAFPFFSNRIMFPIMDMMHNTIGYSARKIYEDTFGGKYINTSKTPLFNKSKVLFGLNYCRSTIAKRAEALIVEGQIDALRLIQEGLDYTVAGQGTAFGEEHVHILRKIGVKQVHLAFDGDTAGREASLKVGQLFQIEGIGVSVIILPRGEDPDGILRAKGIERFHELMEKPMEFIPFAIKVLSMNIDLKTPAGKNQIASQISALIQKWKHPIMIHEGMKKLASGLALPERILDQGSGRKEPLKVQTKPKVNSDRIVELDLLRWLVLSGRTHEDLWELAKTNLQEGDFVVEECRNFYRKLLTLYDANSPMDMLSLGEALEEDDEKLLAQLLEKKVNVQKPVDGMKETVKRMLERNWMMKREEIKERIQKGNCTEEEVLALAEQFDALKKARPAVQCADNNSKEGEK